MYNEIVRQVRQIWFDQWWLVYSLVIPTAAHLQTSAADENRKEDPAHYQGDKCEQESGFFTIFNFDLITISIGPGGVCTKHQDRTLQK